MARRRREHLVDDAPLWQTAAEFCQHIPLSELGVESLRSIAAKHGSDFATAVAYLCLRNDPQYSASITRLEQLAYTQRADESVGNAAVGLVPNLGYFVDPKSQKAGIVLFDVAKQLGFDTFVVPTSHTGDLYSNANVICDTLCRRSDNHIVLVSISKGSSDLKIAFNHQNAGEAFRHVSAWINICGLVDGSAVVNAMLESGDSESERRLIEWFRRQGEDYVQHVIDAMRDCGRGTDRPLGGPLKVPSHIRCYHLAAFALARHFRYAHARVMNQLLLPLGPNDGFALIADLLNKPGTILPVWGADHYVDQTMDVTPLLYALLRAAIEDCHLIDTKFLA